MVDKVLMDKLDKEREKELKEALKKENDKMVDKVLMDKLDKERGKELKEALKKDNDKTAEEKPKKQGSPIINIMCPNCGIMYSERNGHYCGKRYY